MTITTAMKDFLHHCRFEKNLSGLTLKAYNTDLKQFSDFLRKRNPRMKISDISKNELKAYVEYISHLKIKSIKRKVATHKAFFNFLEFEDKIAVSPYRKVKINLREPKRLPNVMNVEEIESLLRSAYKAKSNCSDSIGEYEESLRNVVVIELLYATGARVSEIAKLKMEDMNIQTGDIRIKGKGDKERLAQICNQETLELLGEYYKRFEKRIKKAGYYFLINRLGGRLSDQSIRTIIKNAAKLSGIGRHITPHVFRHSFATFLLEKDVDIKYIQSLLGHSSITTTQIYTHVNRDKQVKILQNKHPRKDFVRFVP